LLPGGFRRVYGENYLSPLVYDAQALGSDIASGRQISFLATDRHGDFAGHIALRRTAPNPRLYEVVQGIVPAEHRKAGIFRHLFSAAIETARAEPGCIGVFGTALTNHAISQRVLGEGGFRDVGYEVDYVPQRMLAREGANGAIATVVQYLDFGRVEPCPTYVAPAYEAWVARLLATCGEAGGPLPVARAPEPDGPSAAEALDMPRFDMARLTVTVPGADLMRRAGAFAEDAAHAGRRTAQVVLALDTPAAAWAMSLLRASGYAFSGILPHYLGDGVHAGLLFRSFDRPNFAEIVPWSEAARWLLDRTVAEWRTAPEVPAVPGAQPLPAAATA
jgi:hypothetical protein